MHENAIERIGPCKYIWWSSLFSAKFQWKQFWISSQNSFFSVNSAFLTLRQLIPTEPKTRKLSKIETLRLAKSYIEHLFAVLITGN